MSGFTRPRAAVAMTAVTVVLAACSGGGADEVLTESVASSTSAATSATTTTVSAESLITAAPFPSIPSTAAPSVPSTAPADAAPVVAGTEAESPRPTFPTTDVDAIRIVAEQVVAGTTFEPAYFAAGELLRTEFEQTRELAPIPFETTTATVMQIDFVTDRIATVWIALNWAASDDQLVLPQQRVDDPGAWGISYDLFKEDDGRWVVGSESWCALASAIGVVCDLTS